MNGSVEWSEVDQRMNLYDKVKLSHSINLLTLYGKMEKSGISNLATLSTLYRHGKLK